jgi:hypothetical protein
MKFRPRAGQAVGRVVVRRPTSNIVRPDATKGTTKFILLDAVGPDLPDKGLNVGDIVLPVAISTIVLDNGASVRPMLEAEKVALTCEEWESLDEFYVQTESGADYVPFDDDRAATSLGIQPLRLVKPPPAGEDDPASPGATARTIAP